MLKSRTSALIMSVLSYNSLPETQYGEISTYYIFLYQSIAKLLLINLCCRIEWLEPIWIRVKTLWQILPQHQSSYLKGTEYASIEIPFVAFCSFFPCSLTVFHRGRQQKVGVDNEKPLEPKNSTVFHRDRQWKSSRAGQQNTFFIFQPDFNIETSPKNATKHPVA